MIFKGITERPYAQKWLEDVDWYSTDHITLKRIVISELWLTQTKLTIAGLLGEQRYSTDAWLRVVEFEKQFYLEDGHHRLLRKVFTIGYRSTDILAFKVCRLQSQGIGRTITEMSNG